MLFIPLFPLFQSSLMFKNWIVKVIYNSIQGVHVNIQEYNFKNQIKNIIKYLSLYLLNRFSDINIYLFFFGIILWFLVFLLFFPPVNKCSFFPDGKCSGCSNLYHTLGGLPQSNLLLTVLEAEKSKMKVPADARSSKDFLLLHRQLYPNIT